MVESGISTYLYVHSEIGNKEDQNMYTKQQEIF